MTRRIDELDLLGWIEGDLSPERRLAVAQALDVDQSLRARVEAMTADRAALRTWAGAERAPAGVVGAAIDEAERLALLGEAPAPIRIAWHRNYRTYSVAAALALALGGVYLISRVYAPATSPIAPASTELAMGTVDDAAPAKALTASASTEESQRSRVAANTLPLESIVESVDRVVSETDSPTGVLSLALTRHDPMHQTAGLSAGARVTSAAFTDALRLASVGRLTVRIQSSDPRAVEAALKRFGSLDDHGVELLAEGEDGSLRFAVEMDRTECEFARLVQTLEQAAPRDVQTFFDVTLLPEMASRSRTGIEPPRQVSGAEPRVSIQVLIAPDAGVSW